MINIAFKSIEISNFMSLGPDNLIELDDQGFVLVKGLNTENQDKGQSNGAGKSSIFDAIFWTLTGSTLRGATDVVNETAGKDCRCSLVFTNNDTTYKILRTKGDSQYGNCCLVYADEILLSDQTQKSQETISKILPTLTPEILGSIILLGQGLPYRFSSLSPTKRKDLLESLSGTDSQVERLRYQLEKESVAREKTLSKILSDIDLQDFEIEAHKQAVQTYQGLQDKSEEEYKQEIRTCEEEILNYQKKIEELSKEKESCDKQISQVDQVLNSAQEYYTEIAAKIGIVVNQLQGVSEGTCPTCGRPYENQSERVQRYQAYQDQLTSLQTTEGTLKTKISSLRDSRTVLSNKLRDVTNTSTSCSYNCSSLKEKIKSLEKDLSSHSKISEEIKNAEEKIKALSVSIYDLTEEKDKLSEYTEALSYLKRQMSRDFKGYVLSGAVDYLSNQSNQYCKYLFDNKKIEISLKGNRIVILLNGRAYENLSGGERQRVDLSVQFALRDLLSTSIGFSCNILVLDEAFDSLDSRGSESLINLVVSEFNEVNSVFTITHHTDISIPYDRVLSVSKNSEGISEVLETA